MDGTTRPLPKGLPVWHGKMLDYLIVINPWTCTIHVSARPTGFLLLKQFSSINLYFCHTYHSVSNFDLLSLGLSL